MTRRCLDCDAIIPAARLRAVPTAQFCVRCQPAHDRPIELWKVTLAVMADGDLEVMQDDGGAR